MVKLQLLLLFKKGSRKATAANQDTAPAPASDVRFDVAAYPLYRPSSTASVDSQRTLVNDNPRQMMVVGVPRRPQAHTRPRSQFTIGARRVIPC
ncbi:hypothetical protein H4R24_001390 [Coemansia sp. RSA 988]|nr:hypothetical protein H4R24_001390 [Coemansia sp. RSA 988]